MASKRDLPTSLRARRVASAIACVCVFGILLAGGVLWSVLVSDRGKRDLAHELASSGVASTVVSLEEGESTNAVIDVGGDKVAVDLVVIYGATPKAGTPVLYRLGDPTAVMTAEDVDAFVNDDLEGGVGFAALCLAPAVLALLAWLIAGRPKWWRIVDRDWVPMGAIGEDFGPATGSGPAPVSAAADSDETDGASPDLRIRDDSRQRPTDDSNAVG
ncbi:hypothetical protein [Cellulomonas sp. URHB0016]